MFIVSYFDYPFWNPKQPSIEGVPAANDPSLKYVFFFRNTRCCSVLKLYSRPQTDQVKLFAVVEFSAKGGQEIAVVQFCWVRELQPNINICFWPTKKSVKRHRKHDK